MLGPLPNDAVKCLAPAGEVWELLIPERAAELKRNLEHRAGLLDQLRKKEEAARLRRGWRVGGSAGCDRNGRSYLISGLFALAGSCVQLLRICKV